MNQQRQHNPAHLPRQQFHTTQQLGFKPILYCWCGGYIDLNKNPRRALHAFHLSHADCSDVPEHLQMETKSV